MAEIAAVWEAKFEPVYMALLNLGAGYLINRIFVLAFIRISVDFLYAICNSF